MFENQNKVTDACGIQASDRKTEIARELDNLDVSICKLRDRLETMYKRITPVLANVPTGIQAEKEADMPATTDVGKIIRSKTVSIKQITDAVCSVTERIEV